MSTIEKMYAAIQDHAELDRYQYEDIANHGADAGWPGFTYTTECVEFYNTHESLIYDLLNETADDMGCDNVEQLISNFNRSDMLSWPEGRKNLLAWFALEEVARAVADGVIEMEGEADDD